MIDRLQALSLAALAAAAIAASVVPEQSTWALVIVGLGLTGSALRRPAAKPAIATA